MWESTEDRGRTHPGSFTSDGTFLSPLSFFVSSFLLVSFEQKQEDPRTCSTTAAAAVRRETLFKSFKGGKLNILTMLKKKTLSKDGKKLSFIVFLRKTGHFAAAG